MATAGATAGIADKLGVGQLGAGMGKLERLQAMSKHAAVGAGVRAGLAGVSGERVKDILASSAASVGVGFAQSVVGDVGVKYGLSEGGASKLALHSITGGALSATTGEAFSAGAIGGAAGELVPSLMESGNGETGPPTQTHQAQIKALTKLTAAAATLAAGGSARDITTAASVGESAVEHNYLGHVVKGLKALIKLAKKPKNVAKPQKLKNKSSPVGGSSKNEMVKGLKSVKDRLDYRGKPNSVARGQDVARNGGGKRAFVFDKNGKIIREITPQRVKVRISHPSPNGVREVFDKVGKPTASDLKILESLW